MAWFLAMEGPANKAVLYQLQETVDVDKIAEEMVSSATLDRAVAVPAVLQNNNHQQVTVYVRPAAWGMWTFYQLTEEERKALASATNPLVEALAQAARQKQAKK
ncbi:hypothetical protein MMAG44476_05886 [Mycolicibacterium mageritense DSM 44476 = CIP 104973]|uniref:Uncharacterized protein n=1 Tax=Mycolicibacterium mageritense TaxID=53462 RepID=A0AAI8U2M1_MYCME|nr:hypothetical protein [Mycolicibacterium mageritense]MBN3453800.1 hypothetical protein [Mycobacterium sp. DSM 3803]OKH79042.1 hypothetical protein EB73_36200 [Mycobacterium sp. SWH-M3]MCC9181208.1 hypothetical protein [Mycolicibacterium mageritense]TXI60443.1 MAG: hypothetical protein E6Q55_19825 [Mycolicibacterium mageritense]CDO27039.1 hypothetical protein BN978_07603 [Mycolicibacterium mageritense DSM 44476 = CIP 104973]